MLATALAGSFAFGPLRDGIKRFQLDPLLGALALGAFALARSRGSGIIQALATLKPQGILLASVGGVVKGRKRFAAELVAGWALLLAATAVVPGPSWRRWIHVVGAAGRGHSAWELSAVVVLALGSAVASVLIWHRLARVLEPGLAAFAIAATLTSAFGQQVFLNSQSRLLMIVPFAVLLSHLPAGKVWRVSLGLTIGLYSTSALFAVSFHSGTIHAAVPIAIAAGFALWAALAVPRFSLTASTAFAANALVSIPRFSPEAHEWIASGAAALVLCLLAHQALESGQRGLFKSATV
jgi:hypothetical protein